MRVVRRNKKQGNRHAEQKLLCRGVLVTVVNLLPHSQIVVCAGVEFKGNASDVVEHDVRARYISNVSEGPAKLLREAGEKIVADLEQGDDNNVNNPGALRVDPGSVKIGQRRLITLLLDSLRLEVSD